MKIIFILTTCTILAGQWLFDIYILHSNSFNNYITTLTFFISPIYLIILVITSVKQSYGKVFNIRTLLIIHYVLLTMIYLVSAIFVPIIISSRASQDIEAHGKALLAQYQYAELMRDNVEAEAYLIHYKKYRDKIIGFDIEEQTINGIPIRQKKLEQQDLEKDFFNPLITSTHMQDLSKEELLFNAKLYFESSHYHTAKMLLLYYREVFGVDSQVLAVESILNEYLTETGSAAFENLRGHHKNLMLEIIYDLINNKSINDSDMIVAQHMLHAFIEDNVDADMRTEAERIQRILLTKFSQRMFFAGDARINLFTFKDKRKSLFVEKKGSSNIIWLAKHSAYNATEDIVYFEDLELITISNLTNIVEQHINTPYAKLHKNKLYLSSVERFALGLKYQPFLHVDNREIKTTVLETIVDTSVTTKEARVLIPNSSYINELNIVDLVNIIPIWEKYSLPTHMIFEVLVRLLVHLSIFAILGLVLIKMIHAVSTLQVYYANCLKHAILIIIGIVPLEIMLETVLTYFLRIFPNILGKQFFLVVASILVIIFMVVNILLHNQRKQMNT